MKTAIIFGITGQDGSFLAELLIEKGYLVHGLRRRSATDNTSNIKHLLSHNRLNLHWGDLADANTIENVLKQTRPDEIYNLAAQSHVAISFETPVYTGDIDGLGVTRILEAMRHLDMIQTTKFYQASTSELYGKVTETPQTETTPFHPRSPYGVAKMYAYWIVKNYRESYGLFGCNGILFNHESARRGENFVTRKITKAIAAISKGEQDFILLGNLSAKRDWGHAKDYVEGMRLMLQHDAPDDYVLATGETRTVREFVEAGFKAIGKEILWHDEAEDEVGEVDGVVRVRVNPKFYRPAEVELLIGNPIKAEEMLGWKRKYSFEQLVQEMVNYDLK